MNWPVASLPHCSGDPWEKGKWLLLGLHKSTEEGRTGFKEEQEPGLFKRRWSDTLRRWHEG